jgi:hypothetical protein
MKDLKDLPYDDMQDLLCKALDFKLLYNEAQKQSHYKYAMYRYAYNRCVMIYNKRRGIPVLKEIVNS